MRIYSEVGHGTMVKLYFPRNHGVAETHKREAGDDIARGNGQRILVVEDDEAVRGLVVGLLSDLGYRVFEAAHAFDALDILAAEAIDLLFTDVVLPEGMNGRELAVAAEKLRPGLKVLFTSGYSENAIVHHGRLDAGVQLLAKPYKKRDLARKLKTLFEGS
jgi:CheY-like chemotaxis protein